MGLANAITQVPIASQAFAAVSKRSPVGAIPDGATNVVVRCDRSTWTGPRTDGNDAVEVLLEVSFDNGVTWYTLVGFTAPGGVMYQGQKKGVDPTGLPVLMESSVTCPVPYPEIAGRKYRTNLTVKQSVTTGISIDWT